MRFKTYGIQTMRRSDLVMEAGSHGKILRLMFVNILNRVFNDL